MAFAGRKGQEENETAGRGLELLSQVAALLQAGRLHYGTTAIACSVLQGRQGAAGSCTPAVQQCNTSSATVRSADNQMRLQNPFDEQLG